MSIQKLITLEQALEIEEVLLQADKVFEEIEALPFNERIKLDNVYSALADDFSELMDLYAWFADTNHSTFDNKINY